MEKIISFSVKHPVSVLMLLFSFIICSLVALKLCPLDYLPEIEDRFLLVSAEYEGLPAEQMKNLVTVPLEDSTASVKGIKKISSITRDGLSLVCLEFRWNVEIETAFSECRQFLDQCYSVLPSGCSKPEVKIFNPYAADTLKVALVPKDGNMKYARFMADNDFKPRLQRVEGVSEIKITGGEKEELQLNFDRLKLQSMGGSLDSVAKTLFSSNFEYPAGTVIEGSREFSVKTDGLLKNMEEFEKIPLSLSDGSLVKLENLTFVASGSEEGGSYFSFNGREAVCAGISRKNGTSPIFLSGRIKKVLEELSSVYGRDFEFFVVSDFSIQLSDSIRQLVFSLLTGVFITIFVLILFFRRLDAAFLVASVMPLSVLGCVLCLRIFSRTLNLISISGIAVGIGMVIDSSIVLVENFFSKTSRSPEGGENLVLESALEVRLSSVGSALTTIVVFLPFFFLEGLTGKLFSDLALAVISSVFFSCVFSLSCVPAVLVLLCRKNRFEGFCLPEGRIFCALKDRYVFLLNGLLLRRKIVPSCLFALFLCGAAAAFFLKIEMMPSVFSPELTAKIYFDEGVSDLFLRKNSRQLEKILSENENFSSFTLSCGVEKTDFESLSETETSRERIILCCTVRDVKLAKDFLEGVLKGNCAKYSVETSKNLLEQVMDTDGGKRILLAEDEKSLKQKLDFYAPAFFEPDSTAVEYVFEPDRKICSQYNIPAGEIAKAAREILKGTDGGYFYEGGKKTKIKLKYASPEISNPQEILQSLVVFEGTKIPLGALGSLKKQNCEKVFFRFNRREGKILRLFADDPLKKNTDFLSDCENPGQENLKELFKNALSLLFVVVLLLYCVMGAQFESFSIPLFMLLALPPAFTGAFLSLLVFRQSLNINSIIALVILFGTSVNNSIIIFESIENLDPVKKRTTDNLCLCCKQKFRSVFITTLTSVLALLPFAIDPLGKNAQSSMATAVTGGLFFSFAIVIFAVPCILFSFYSGEKVSLAGRKDEHKKQN